MSLSNAVEVERPRLVSNLPIRKQQAHSTHISLKNVGLSFKAANGPPTVALENINLEIVPGEFLCIVGPSGCGKTSLLHQIAGLSFPTSGEVQLNGQRVKGPGTDRILMFQDHGLFPWLTVGQNVEFGLRMKSVARGERRDIVDKYLHMVQLSGFKDSYIHQLSGGMRQRVALARALSTEPDILLMDEPFAALDAQTRDMLHDELENLWISTGRTIVFVTHNVREAVRLGDRVALMTFRPGTIKNKYVVGMPRPRQIEDAPVAELAGDILSELRGEINRSRDAEFQP